MPFLLFFIHPINPPPKPKRTMNLIKTTIALATIASACAASHAGEAYGGIGFPGATLGYTHPYSDVVTLRGEFAGGINVSKDGKREGVTYTGSFKSNRIGAYADWHPGGSGFHLTGGLAASDIQFDLKSVGGSGTIGGQPVNLNGDYFNVKLKYPTITPYLGVGYGHKPVADKGWGFFANIGVTIGKFKVSADTNIVGKQGVTQANVDTEVQKVRDGANKLAVLPAASLGLTRL
jgi:hypothetical protein